MISESEKIERFSESINNAASKLVKKYNAEAEERLKAETESIKNEIARKFETRLKFETDRILSKTNKQITALENDFKKTISKKRDEVTRQVFSGVLKNIEAFEKSGEYLSFLEKSLLKMSSALGGKIVVFCREKDVEAVETISKKLGISVLEINVDNEIHLGGISASDEDQSTIICDTLDSRLDSAKENFLIYADLSI